MPTAETTIKALRPSSTSTRYYLSKPLFTPLAPGIDFISCGMPSKQAKGEPIDQVLVLEGCSWDILQLVPAPERGEDFQSIRGVPEDWSCHES